MVFGITALKHSLRNIFKSFSAYNQAEQWITNEGINNKEYIILEVFKKK